MPKCDTRTMNERVLAISGEVNPTADAVLILDQAGWHSSSRLIVPENNTLLFLSPGSFEINPVEKMWQFMRDNWQPLLNSVKANAQRLVGSG